MSDLADLAAARAAHLDDLLGAAIRVEVALYLSRHIEGRVVHRPHWLARTPRMMLEEMRRQTDRRAEALVGEVTEHIAAIRAELGTDGGNASDEFAAVGAGLAPVLAKAAKALLLAFFVPGDDTPDGPDPSADLSPSFQLNFEPTLGLRWAFSQARMMDVARLQLDAAGGRPVEPTFELRMFLPEALPGDGH